MRVSSRPPIHHFAAAAAASTAPCRCNLVVCRCGQAFCWLCGQGTGRAHTWTNIEGHSCGAYKEEAEARASEAQRCVRVH